eukprot:5373667-Pyramimonas_sp.AAC.1
MGAVAHAIFVTRVFGGVPCKVTEGVRGAPQWGGWRRHANAATGALGGAPNGARERGRGMPT